MYNVLWVIIHCIHISLNVRFKSTTIGYISGDQIVSYFISGATRSTKPYNCIGVSLICVWLPYQTYLLILFNVGVVFCLFVFPQNFISHHSYIHIYYGQYINNVFEHITPFIHNLSLSTQNYSHMNVRRDTVIWYGGISNVLTDNTP